MNEKIEEYLREVDASLRVAPARKAQIVDELRTHLVEKADDVHAADPSRPRAEVEQEVLREFGDARDLALAYDADGAAILTRGTNETVLRLGHAVGRGAAAVGRGTGKALKWIAIALAALLVLSIGVGAWAYYEVKPHIPDLVASTAPVYEYHERCVATPCNGVRPADSFYVREGADTVRFEMGLAGVHPPGDRDRHVGNGTIAIKVVDPAGAVRFDRVLEPTDEAALRHDMSWAALAGNWTIEVTFTEFVGDLDLEAWAVSLPFDERT